uniref:Ig-like domain-containing protein n=1 Tax=Scleropages formosus TaxID=113540 RepID=A0A8C9SHU2_SCLFO
MDHIPLVLKNSHGSRTFFLLWWADSQITVQRGRSLSIQCHYDEEYRDHVKYWCRMITQSSCTTIVSTDTPERSGQVSITDNNTLHVFHVTMSDLQTMDSDVYWCGVETCNTEIYMASLNLTVTMSFFPLTGFCRFQHF